ncbi:MAG: efflux RND transporter permease subunit, partial [Gammaproteobacteria bacterium]
MRFRIARFIMAHRAAVSIVFLLITLGFSAGFPNIDIRTVFNDLLPKDDPFVQVYFDHRNFGNPLTMSIMVKRKEGDIYHPDTLDKVFQLTRDIDLAPGVDHDQVISISTEKLRYAEATPDGINMRPLMDDRAPHSAEEVHDFRQRVERSPNARTFFISNDGTATLINASFQDSIEFGKAFDYAQALIEDARDADHEVYLAGQPTLIGWVYRLQQQTYYIFGITVAALMIALALYMRNIAGVVTPIVCALVAAIWGFGFIGWLGRPIEPLLMIVPLLLVARSFSHCVQFAERYYEVLMEVPDRRKAAEVTMGIMMAPSILGITTDVFGITFIAVAPIETMINHALFCGAWALWIIPTGIFLAAILLSYLPVPKNIEQIVGGSEKESGIHLLEEKALEKLASFTHGRNANFTAVVILIFSVGAIYINSQIKIGNPVEGSNVLWYDSEFNTAVRAINAHFPGMNTLEIILEAKQEDRNHRVARTPDIVAAATQLQRLLESDTDLPPRATLSFTDYMGETNRLFSGGNPKWGALDLTAQSIDSAGFATLMGSSPINFSHVVDFGLQHSTITLWYKDNIQETVDTALANAKRAVETVGLDHPEFTIRLGTGVIPLQQSMNLVVERYHWFILGLLNCAIALMSWFAYRSLMAAAILMIPVNIANFGLGATMHLLGIGMDINAVIVAVMGIGVGIDYGIYLLSRICEEYTAHDHDLAAALESSLTTTGKAIMFTASVMLIGIVPWYFLSDLKFMADMGLLLVIVMVINMALSLIVLPTIVWFTKPKFLARQD